MPAARLARPSKASLNIENVYKAMKKAEALLPGAVDKLAELLDDDETTPAEIVKIVGCLQSLVRYAGRTDEDLGISRRGSTGSQKPLLMLIGASAKLGDLRRLSNQEKEDLFFAAVGGDAKTVKTILPEAIQ